MAQEQVEPEHGEAETGEEIEGEESAGGAGVLEVGRPLGAEFEPVLCEACGGRLSEIRWFRTDWQRGGALTGYAVYQDEGGVDREVVVKLPVRPGERLWLMRLQTDNGDGVAPRLYAHGESLGGYDFAWVVMERLPYGPLGQAWGGKAFDLLIEAAGRFYVAASEFAVDCAPKQTDWEVVYERARGNVKRHSLEEEQRWNGVLKKAKRKMEEWVGVWRDRPVDQWCHGDLHLANAMTRVEAPGGPVVLLDFAVTRPGCWVEDAVYLEHLYWGRREALEGRKVCKLIAQERKKVGLRVDRGWSDWAQAGRALFAMGAPALLHREGDAKHLRAALEILEREVG